MDPNKANIAFVGGLQGYDTIGREVLLMFMHFLTKGYTEKQTRIQKLLESTRIHIVPMAFQKGMDSAVDGDCTGEKFPKDVGNIYNKFLSSKVINLDSRYNELRMRIKMLYRELDI